ncbi:hypothetical protein XENOCAPTIV_017153 [Xenoophorus captivus]|uniref:RUN domain-containing protein n=1 Tax=Xenoophorus captivus TaxID=1517983 RepID=A0ABV0SD09_9TELE
MLSDRVFDISCFPYRQLYKPHAFLLSEEEREQFLYHLLSLNTVDYLCFTRIFTSVSKSCKSNQQNGRLYWQSCHNEGHRKRLIFSFRSFFFYDIHPHPSGFIAVPFSRCPFGVSTTTRLNLFYCCNDFCEEFKNAYKAVLKASGASAPEVQVAVLTKHLGFPVADGWGKADRLLSQWFPLLAECPLTARTYEDGALLRDRAALHSLCRILQTLNDFSITLEAALVKGVDL